MMYCSLSLGVVHRLFKRGSQKKWLYILNEFQYFYFENVQSIGLLVRHYSLIPNMLFNENVKLFSLVMVYYICQMS